MILLYLMKWRLVLKLQNLNLVIDPGLLNTRIILEKITPKVSQGKYLLLILCWKLINEYIKSKIEIKKK